MVVVLSVLLVGLLGLVISIAIEMYTESKKEDKDESNSR